LLGMSMKVMANGAKGPYMGVQPIINRHSIQTLTLVL
jgi:hypothetical protein